MPTAFSGELLFADAGLDPYLEDPATLWLLHWQIAGNRTRATTWFWAFNYFHEPEFTREILSAALLKWTQISTKKAVAESSLKRDVEVFLRTYVRSRQGKNNSAALAKAKPIPLNVLLNMIIRNMGQPFVEVVENVNCMALAV